MKSFLLGQRIYMRELLIEEVTVDSPYFGWMNDLSLDRFTERSYFPTGIDGLIDYVQHAHKHRDVLHLGIFDNASDKHIGNITFNQINWFNRRAFIAYMLGDTEFAGKGIISDAVLMFMYYGFNKLNFERIHGGVSDAHPASIRVCEKVGLLEEGRQRHHLYRNGEYHDNIIVGALREEWMTAFGEKAAACFAEQPT